MTIKKRNILLILLIGSVALNIGFLAAFALKYFAKPSAANVRTCPMSSDYNHFYMFLGLNDDQLAKTEPLAHD